MSDLKNFNLVIQSPKTQSYMESVLGERKSSFCNNIVALVGNNKQLQECEPMSLIYAGIKATALNLPLDSNLGFAYVIAYKNNKLGITDAQFQIGWKGYVQLAIRSGQYRRINVTEVHEGELKKVDLITGDIVIEALPNRDDLPVVGYVAYFELINGFSKIMYMTCEQLKKHGEKYSQTYGSRNVNVRENSKWATEFDAMAKKTVLKLLIGKFGPMSVEMQDAVRFDQSVIREDGQPHYVDNEQSEYSDAMDENGVIRAIMSAQTEDEARSIAGENPSDRVAEAIRIKFNQSEGKSDEA